jgi:16S rRNA (guanine(966)-N(2))-methyltransferase RsmD
MVPEGSIRPAMDRMRESVFAVLGDLTGLSFLDLFSGSGIIALEAASRGAEPVEAVEMDKLKRKTLLKNVLMAPVQINCRFMAVELYVKRTKRTFNVIFCDPPFPYQYKRELAAAIASSPLMASGSRLLIHRPREKASAAGDPVWPAPMQETGAIPNLTLRDRREYGRSVVDFFEK